MSTNRPVIYDRAFISGNWVSVRDTEVVPVINPASEERIAVVHGAGESDAIAACESAARAFGRWSRLPMTERASLVARVASTIEGQAEYLARLITDEIGTPIVESRSLQVGAAARVFRQTAEVAAAMELVETIGSTKVFSVPVGVVACITPWNYPLFQMACKLAPALVAGCTVVLKPSVAAPGSATALAEILREVGMPEGVFNMVIGSGSELGEHLIQNAAIDAVSFTGSTGAGERVAALSGKSLKRVSLELGGKSPSVLLPDAKFPLAIKRTIAKCFQNAGQTCAALSRLIVPHERTDEAVRYVAEAARGYRIGDPHLESTQLGPVAAARQRDRIRELMLNAAADGAELITGGPEPPPGMARGFFVQPSAYVAHPEMRIAYEEVFGPVLTLLPYADQDEALQLAQRGEYGLSGAVWSQDSTAAEEFARKLRSGSISVNGASTHPGAPFGGFRRSGFGRERGRRGIEEFLTTQAVHFGP
jgi:aldehyde dehydrogenase (NAD+)